MAKAKKNKKLKLKKHGCKRLIIILLILYLLGSIVYYLFNLPIKNIHITGTDVLTDHEIIITSGIKDYPSIFKTSNRSLSKKLKKNPIIKDVEIKKDIFGKLTLNITENKPLFYNKTKEKIILENGEEINDANKYLKIPTLINIVPNKIYKSLLEKIKDIDYDIIKLISEIEYVHSETNEESDRFLLRMNDNNTVYINLLNIKNLNLYLDMFTAFSDERGTLYLDSSNSVNFFFKAY